MFSTAQTARIRFSTADKLTFLGSISTSTMRNVLLTVLSLAFAKAAFAFTPTEDGLYAVFDTSKGEFVVVLAYDAVPLTVANFVGLAEGIIPWRDPETKEIRTDPLYNDTLFYQVVRNAHIWAGDPAQKGDGKGNPGYTIPQEIHPNLIPNRGAIVMYNTWAPKEDEYVDIGENTAGSEFFILLREQQSFDGRYAVFGYVVEGMDIVDEIGAVAVNSDTGRPTTDIVIESVTIVREGEKAEAFSVADYQLPRVSIRVSDDLQDWSDDTLEPGETAEERLTELMETLQAGESVFVGIDGADFPDYEDTLPDATFTAELFGLPHEGTWTHSFNEDGLDDDETYGSVTISNGISSTSIRDYGFEHLPDGGRLKIVTNNGYVITYFLRFTSETGGGAFAWVEYLPQQLRFAATGTFTLTPRP